MTSHLRIHPVLALAAAALLAAGCGGSGGGGGGGGGGTSGGTDAGTVGGTDGGTVGGTDGGTVGGTDGGTVGGTDGGTADGGSTGGGSLTGALTLDLLAGDVGGPGSFDGKGSAARFDAPWGITGDTAGNLYVADFKNETIRKIDPTGTVTTFAGQATRLEGTPVNGKGTAATFYMIRDIAIGPQGNLYVTEMGDVRKVAPDGTVTSFAGALGAPAGDTDGTGTAASFDSPWGIGVDAQGNVYVSESLGCVIRKITPAGVVTTLAGQAGQRAETDGTGSAARFNDPESLAVGPNGNVWVSDASGIRKITPAGVVTTPYPGVYAQALAFDGQGRLVYDATDQVQRFDASGSSTVVAGAPGSFGHVDGPAASAEFNMIRGLFVDASGNIFVADTGNTCIREVSAGGTVTTVAGSDAGGFQDVDGTGAAARFTGATRIAADGQGGAYVLEGLDSMPTVLRHVDAGGKVTTLIQGSNQLEPGFITTTPSGTVYVVGTNANYSTQIDSVASDGTLTPFVGGATGGADGKGTAAGLGNVRSLTADAAGNLWFVDTKIGGYQGRLRKVSPDGTVTTVATFTGMGPQGLVVGPSGQLYAVAPYGVTTVGTDGTIKRLAGGQGPGNTDGQGSAAGFNLPGGMAVGAGGDLFLADTTNGLLRRITPGGMVTTLVGAVDQRKIVPGPVPTTLDDPLDVAFAKDGSLLILDGGAVLRLHQG